ncbi:MAG: DUF3604 domain-containing protein [Pseudomonadota bacterium]|nr:DUF3604 domain-containing protein [Pseudomonadota bacterium]
MVISLVSGGLFMGSLLTRLMLNRLCFYLYCIFSLMACSKVHDPSLEAQFEGSGDEFVEQMTEKTEPSALKNVYWGDLHIHTSLSYDAYTFGVTALPDQAYTFAKGGVIEHALGYPIRLSRPLDFAAVTDHAEWLGVARHANGPLVNNERLKKIVNSGNPLSITFNYFRTVISQMGDLQTRIDNFGSLANQSITDAAWQQIIDSAERHNSPGQFTAFIAYEWTSMPNEDNLHRNIIYRSRAVPNRPFSALDSEDPLALWQALEKQRSQGQDAIAIPHNANLSNGLMYGVNDFSGNAITPEYSALRLRNEPISEILQVKGASETHPLLSEQDEFANFEIHDLRLSADGTKSLPSGSYARDALRTGLVLDAKLGINPYQFGFIGSSDGHGASAPVEEASYHGKLPMGDGTAGIRLGETLLLPRDYNRGGMWSAMGLAAIWAEENTRESLFKAMQRKETYATSGPRIRLRFFAAESFPDHVLGAENWLAQAYKLGVPMGGQLVDIDSNSGPEFIIYAEKDPLGANLDRAQIVKVWLDVDGQSHEKVYNVAAADQRQIDFQGNMPSLMSTVDVASASYDNSIGGVGLFARWKDPDFNSQQPAAYYARVIEIPTPRWTTYDAKILNVEAPAPQTLQERAISSAIWYSPST